MKTLGVRYRRCLDLTADVAPHAVTIADAHDITKTATIYDDTRIMLLIDARLRREFDTPEATPYIALFTCTSMTKSNFKMQMP